MSVTRDQGIFGWHVTRLHSFLGFRKNIMTVKNMNKLYPITPNYRGLHVGWVKLNVKGGGKVILYPYGHVNLYIIIIV